MQNELFKSVNTLLDHIKNVQEDVIAMTKESYLVISKTFADKQIELSDEALETLQYQDIISQQLTAIVEAIASVQESISDIPESNQDTKNYLPQIGKKLDEVTALARQKRDAFSGKLGHENEETIEFF